MIAISKTEKAVISKELPDAHVVRTMKQKSGRHHYYCEESDAVMQILSQLRKDGMKGGANHRYN